MSIGAFSGLSNKIPECGACFLMGWKIVDCPEKWISMMLHLAHPSSDARHCATFLATPPLVMLICPGTVPPGWVA